MTVDKLAAVTLLLGALAAAGCNTTTQAEYEVGQAVLKTDPDIRRSAIAGCRKKLGTNWSTVDHANMAAVMNVPVSRASATFCTRVIKAIANGRLSYADLTKAERNGSYETLIRIMQGR